MAPKSDDSPRERGATQGDPHERRGVISSLMEDPQQERAFLSTIGFTGGFAACRGITHAIRRILVGCTRPAAHETRPGGKHPRSQTQAENPRRGATGIPSPEGSESSWDLVSRLPSDESYFCVPSRSTNLTANPYTRTSEAPRQRRTQTPESLNSRAELAGARPNPTRWRKRTGQGGLRPWPQSPEASCDLPRHRLSPSAPSIRTGARSGSRHTRPVSRRSCSATKRRSRAGQRPGV